MVEQELASEGYIETCISKDSYGDLYKTSVSAKGKRAILDNLSSSELVSLIQDGVSIGSSQSAAELVVGVSKQFLPELLSSGCRAVREEALERLDKLNGLECETA